MRPIARVSIAVILVLAGNQATRAADEPAAPPAAPAADLTVAVPTFANATCPIMGKPSSLALFTDTEFGRIYVCCPPCNRKIAADPERAYKVAYPTTKPAGNAVCPITGKAVGETSATVVLQGIEIRVCSAECVAKAKADVQATLVKAMRPGTVDVGNTVCPVTGTAVAANAFCLVGSDLIRLSSPAAVEEVRKAPAAMLAKARESVAKPATPASTPAPTR